MSKGEGKKKKKAAKKAAKAGGAKVTRTLVDLSKNPLVADVVAAALVATAAALKDTNKAHRLAAAAGDELEALARDNARRGNAMWQLALEVGRRALSEIAPAPKAKKAAPKAKKAAPKAKKAPASAPAKAAAVKRKPAAKPAARAAAAKSRPAVARKAARPKK